MDIFKAILENVNVKFSIETNAATPHITNNYYGAARHNGKNKAHYRNPPKDYTDAQKAQYIAHRRNQRNDYMNGKKFTDADKIKDPRVDNSDLDEFF